MQRRSFEEALEIILKEDSRYPAEAYFFLREGLDYTIKALEKPTNGPARHVSGRELLEGLRVFAVQEFGPLALTVLKAWGITRTEDFGEIVFNLVDKGVLGKTNEDKRQDFADGYRFEDAFVKPFQPKRPRQAAEPSVVPRTVRMNPNE